MKHMRLLDSTFNNLINDQNKIGEVLSNTCNIVQDIFDKLTGKRCSVSIKLLEQDQSEIRRLRIDEILGCNVQNIARDADHQKRDTKEYNNTKHLIRQNTAYATIVGNLGKKTLFYLNNDVNIHNSYSTTSPYVDEDNRDINPPYKSELVLPIYQSQGSETYRFIGFLCIDCEEKDTFSKNDISFEIASITASKLYWVFNKYYNHEKQ